MCVCEITSESKNDTDNGQWTMNRMNIFGSILGIERMQIIYTREIMNFQLLIELKKIYCVGFSIELIAKKRKTMCVVVWCVLRALFQPTKTTSIYNNNEIHECVYYSQWHAQQHNVTTHIVNQKHDCKPSIQHEYPFRCFRIFEFLHCFCMFITFI